MKKTIIILAAALLLAGGAGGYWWYVNRDRRMVTELVNNVVALVKKEPSNLPHAGVLKFARVDELFAEKVDLRCEEPAIGAAMTRDELKTMVSLMNRRIEKMDAAADNIEPEIAGDRAVFTFDAEFSGVVGGRKEYFNSVYQISGTAVKIDGKWLISSLKAEEILQ